jgi:hypothetical protein
MVGQNWAISQMEKIAPVYVRYGWQEDGNGTSQIRKQLGLVKDKENKSAAKPDTHAVDGVALACGYFLKYARFTGSNSHGYVWKGKVTVTSSPFKIITRPGAVKRGKEYGFFRRQLHFEVPDKSGKRKRKGGTTTPFGLRIGDLVRAEKADPSTKLPSAKLPSAKLRASRASRASVTYIGYVGGYTKTEKTKKVSVCDYTWKRIGQFSRHKVNLIRRSNGLCVA